MTRDFWNGRPPCKERHKCWESQQNTAVVMKEKFTGLSQEGCSACFEYVPDPAKSVRGQHKFDEKMARFFGDFDNALYAAEQLCGRKNPSCICTSEEKECAWRGVFMTDANYTLYSCKLHSARMLIGYPVEQHDITKKVTKENDKEGK